MNTRTHMTKNSMAGYTLDQTILIVAVIAILVTIIVGSMGWQLLSRAGGTKLASHLRQIETANGQFYSEHNLWPFEAAQGAGSDGNNNVLTLVALEAAFDSAALDPATANPQNYLPSYEVQGATLRHPFGNGGVITQEVESMPGSTQNYLTITMQNVPRAEALEADESIDSKSPTPFAQGRVQVLGDDGASSTVELKYYANVVN